MVNIKIMLVCKSLLSFHGFAARRFVEIDLLLCNVGLYTRYGQF